MVEVKNVEVFNTKSFSLEQILVTFDIKTNNIFCEDFQIDMKDFIMSQSTMHSMEKFMSGDDHDPFTKYVTDETKQQIKRLYNEWHNAKQTEDKKLIYECFMKLIHNLPRGFELWATVTSNYLQLKTMVIQRFHHPQQEDWGAFIKFCYSLPLFRELCGFEDEKWDIENGFPLLAQ